MTLPFSVSLLLPFSSIQPRFSPAVFFRISARGGLNPQFVPKTQYLGSNLPNPKKQIKWADSVPLNSLQSCCRFLPDNGEESITGRIGAKVRPRFSVIMVGGRDIFFRIFSKAVTNPYSPCIRSAVNPGESSTCTGTMMQASD